MRATVVANELWKRYRIGKGLTSLRELFSVGKGARGGPYHWAIRDVSFEVRPGEALGIIGPNGAGKTTILRILSQVTRPTRGEVQTEGRLSALIELGAGFHPDLTGRENVYLNGAILGMRRHEIRRRFDDIVAFSGVGEYIDTPVRRYSSGMYARLGFSIASHVDPQVLLVDEVLAVGDYAFQQKCYARMSELRSGGTSLILVSHNMEAVRRVCDRGLVMYGGTSIFQGTANDAVIAYSDAIREAARRKISETPTEDGLSRRVMTFEAEIEAVRLLDGSGQETTMVEPGAHVKVSLDIRFHRDVHSPIFACTVRTPDGRIVYDTTTRWMGIVTPDFLAGDLCRVEFGLHPALLEGEYELGVDIACHDLSRYYDKLERATGFWVKGSDSSKGIADLKATFGLRRVSRGHGTADSA